MTIDDNFVPKISTPKEGIFDDSKKVTLQIREEQIDIAKKWIQTGEVKIYRESFMEEKTFIVPIMREELVIERINLDSTILDHKSLPMETIRILLSKEQVEFTKRRVALEDVSIYKRQIKDIKHIEGTLKREKAKIKTSGSAKVID